MTIIGGLSSYLAGLTGLLKGQVVISYDTGGVFSQWNLSAWDGVSAWKNLSNAPHYHTGGASDNTALNEIFERNTKLYFYNEMLQDYISTVSGTGATYSLQDDGTNVYRRHQTGTTTSGFSTAYRGGIKIDFANRITWAIAWKLSALNNEAFIFGPGGEAINVAANNNSKFGLEWCDAQAFARYYMMSGSGTARSLSDSTVATSTAIDGVKVIFQPADKLIYLFDTGVSVNKTTNLPTGNSLYNNILRTGIKNNNGGSANRELWILGNRLNGIAQGAEWPA